MPGTIFVSQGDISDIQADAVVCSTSTYLAAQGLSYSAFARQYPGFAEELSAIRVRRPVVGPRGRRCNIGDSFWLPIANPASRLKGIVVVAVTGGKESIAERATVSVRNAIRTAVDQLQRANRPDRQARWLIAVPTIGLGMGGYSRELRVATESMVRAAAEEINHVKEFDGVRVDIDVAFIAYTQVNYRLLLDARRSIEAEPPCPLDGETARGLVKDIRARRCVLFVGAGLSRGAGLPDWAQLLRAIAEDLGLCDDHLPRDSHGQVSLDLCLDLAQWHVDQFGREKLESLVHTLFGNTSLPEKCLRPTLAHYLLLSMPFRTFLTTNYDDLLERALTALRKDPEVVCTPEGVVKTGDLETPCVVKMHGDATQRTPVVLTRDDFDTFFRDHPVTAALLQGLLLNHTFFFVGYDLRDPNTRQVYSSVAHLLKKAKSRAYSLSVRDEDATSRFYEEQWRRQGLITLRMPGPDRIQNSLLFFDWLARQTFEVESFLHPDLKDQLGADVDKLAGLRQRLHQLAEEAASLMSEEHQGVASRRATMILTVVLDVLTQLGWKPRSREGWLELAERAEDVGEKAALLRRALGAAEAVGELERIREKMKKAQQAT